MIMNSYYRAMLKRGKWIEANSIRRVNESAWIVSLCIGAAIWLIIIFGCVGLTHAQLQPALTGTASWYSVASCKKEGTSGIMANGRKLDDRKFTAASWGYKFGTKVRITNLDNQKSVVVIISDRGPSKRLYNKGRIVDLSVAAFESISVLRKGIIKIKLEEI